MSLSVVIPVFNEQTRLPRGLPQLHSFLAERFGEDWEIVIANNGSTDRTQAVAEELAARYPRVRVLWREQAGRGGALRAAWLESTAEVLSYMDVDLSTDLEALPGLVSAIGEQGYDLAIGSRFLPGAHRRRGWRRELTSRVYIGLVRVVLGSRLSDTQCGFKALSRSAALALLPQVEDTGWFFDTELLVLAERLGYRIAEVPVNWVEDCDSRVRLLATAWADLRGLGRLRRRLASSNAGHSRKPAAN